MHNEAEIRDWTNYLKVKVRERKKINYSKTIREETNLVD
jgi:hypothetical protein